MWKFLEERYRGQNVKDAHVIIAFMFVPPLKSLSMKELERILDVISVQDKYNKKYVPASLQSERWVLFQTAQEKLNQEFSMKFVCHTTRNNYVPNFISLKRFLKAKFVVAQTTEREYRLNKLSKFNVTATHSNQNLYKIKMTNMMNKINKTDRTTTPQTMRQTLKDWLKMTSPSSFTILEMDKESQQTTSKDFKVSYVVVMVTKTTETETQQGTQKALGYKGARGGLPRPTPPASQYKIGQCSCCKQAHNLLYCPKFETLKSSMQLVISRRDKLCYHCFIRAHYAKDC